MGEPVKFEAGMVVRFALLERDADRALLMRRINDKHLTCDALDDETQIFLLSRIGYAGSAHVISPAPRAGDTWTSGESVACIESDGAQLRIVSEREPFVGDVVAVARKLWEGGYRMARRMPTFEELFARDPVAQALVKQMERDALRRAASAVPDRTRITHANVDGRTAPVARTLRDGRTAYVTLEDMKECAPASLSAFDGTWPVFTPSAEVDGGIHPTREGVERVIERLRAAEMVWLDAKQRVRCGEPAPSNIAKGETIEVEIPLIPWSAVRADPVRAHERQMQLVNDAISTAILGPAHACPREHDGEFRVPLPRAGDVYEHADGTIVEICEREWRPGLRTHVLRAAVTCPLLVEADEPALLAAMLREHGYTRRDGKWRVYESRDRLSASGAAEAIQRVSGYGVPISADDIRERFGLPQARIDATTPQSALGRARADRATSRRNVDAAVARLRGEPFARAIQAALAGVSERANLTPAEVAAAIAALRHWEARRPFGVALRADAHVSLSRSSAEALRGALGYAPVWDTDLLFSTYERARPHC